MAGVYISYPFCEQKCSFCNFASDVGSAASEQSYGAALVKEIRAHPWAWEPETLYFGGGTPSLMPLELLRQIFASVPCARLTETTIECAPGSLDESKVRAWVQLGINRVSLGVQSFVTAELRRTGRRHDAATVEQDIRLLRRCGIDNINIDLIAGLPGQTRESWQKSLEWIEQFQPSHVSVYLFEVDEDSRLGLEILRGGTRYGAALTPTDELAAEFYETAVARLQEMDLLRYEISNFARPGKESRHNLKYWRLEPYAGFGLDASSFDGSVRRSNPDELAHYLRGQIGGESLSNPEEEHFFVGLRLSAGIEPSTREWERFSQPIEKWLASGMLERDGSRLRLSHRGVLLSNEVLADFV